MRLYDFCLFFIIWSPMTLNKRRLCTCRRWATEVILFGLSPEEFPGPSFLLTSVFPGHWRLLALTTIKTAYNSLLSSMWALGKYCFAKMPSSAFCWLAQTSQKVFLIYCSPPISNLKVTSEWDLLFYLFCTARTCGGLWKILELFWFFLKNCWHCHIFYHLLVT
jgi:hypothetical protein